MQELEKCLFDAIQTGNLKDTEVYIRKGANVNAIQEISYAPYTPLMLACKLNMPKIVESLLNQPDINLTCKLTDNFGGSYTPFLQVLRSDANGSHTEIVNILLNDKRLSKEEKQYALLYYSKIGDLSKVKELIEIHQCEVNYLHDEFGCALNIAIQNKQIELVDYFLSLARTNINCKNELGETPITIALRENNPKIAELFLKRADLDLHAMNGRSGTPLTAAIYYKNMDLAEKLLDKEEKFKDKLHPGAVLHTIRSDDAKFLEKLIAKGADVNGTSGEENCPKDLDDSLNSETSSIFVAIGWPFFDLPIVKAIQDNSSNVIPVLLAHGADMNKKGKRGKSATDLLQGNEVSKKVGEVIELYQKKQNSTDISVAKNSAVFFKDTSLTVNHSSKSIVSNKKYTQTDSKQISAMIIGAITLSLVEKLLKNPASSQTIEDSNTMSIEEFKQNLEGLINNFVKNKQCDPELLLQDLPKIADELRKSLAEKVSHSIISKQKNSNP